MTLDQAIQELSGDKLQLLALPIFFGAIGIEWYWDKYKELGLYKTKDFWTSIGMLLITAVVELFPKILAFIAFYLLHEISPLRDIIGRQWWAWVLLFFMDDFSYYWFHRKNHEVRLFWAGHVSHHSSQFMNLGTALRQGAGERVHKYFFWLWIPLLGFDPLMMFVVISVNLIFQFWVHTDLVDKLPSWIEYVFNTPSHHRVHHASNHRYLDRNHAGVFILWDRIFGTFSQEVDHEPVVYGLTANITSHNPFYVATHEYGAIWKDVRRANKWSDKLKYIFYAPGWSHDGPDLRAVVLRKGVE